MAAVGEAVGTVGRALGDGGDCVGVYGRGNRWSSNWFNMAQSGETFNRSLFHDPIRAGTVN